jgi:histidinol-phosphate/aromatic aminotransferase/cobyric acid decarboxylase-like protein
LKEKLYELAPDKEKQVYMNSLLWELNNIIKNWNNNDLAKFVLNEFIEDKDKLTKEITNKIEETLETISNTNFYNELKNSWDNWILFNIKTSWEDVKNNSWFNSLIQSFINESNKLKSIFNFKI